MKLTEIVTEAVKYPSPEAVKKYLSINYKITDEDMGNVFVIDDPKSQETFDVRSGAASLEVTPHQISDKSSALADEIYRNIIADA